MLSIVISFETSINFPKIIICEVDLILNVKRGILGTAEFRLVETVFSFLHSNFFFYLGRNSVTMLASRVR